MERDRREEAWERTERTDPRLGHDDDKYHLEQRRAASSEQQQRQQRVASPNSPGLKTTEPPRRLVFDLLLFFYLCNALVSMRWRSRNRVPDTGPDTLSASPLTPQRNG